MALQKDGVSGDWQVNGVDADEIQINGVTVYERTINFTMYEIPHTEALQSNFSFLNGQVLSGYASGLSPYNPSINRHNIGTLTQSLGGTFSTGASSPQIAKDTLGSLSTKRVSLATTYVSDNIYTSLTPYSSVTNTTQTTANGWYSNQASFYDYASGRQYFVKDRVAATGYDVFHLNSDGTLGSVCFFTLGTNTSHPLYTFIAVNNTLIWQDTGGGGGGDHVSYLPLTTTSASVDSGISGIKSLVSCNNNTKGYLIPDITSGTSGTGYYTADGSTFTPYTFNLPSGVANTEYSNRIIGSPSSDKIVLLHPQSGKIFTSNDGGTTWKEGTVTNGAPFTPGGTYMSLLAEDGKIVFATNAGSPFRAYIHVSD